MGRHISYVRARGVATQAKLRARDIAPSFGSRATQGKPDSERRVLSVGRPGRHEDSVDDILSSALVAQDKELAHILHEMDQISKALKTEAPDTETLSDTLHRAVLCAVKQSLLDRELRSLALTDDLTGLYNRRAFLALAGQQLRVTRRKAQGLLLFFADLDNLKEINDIYGHREGDLAIVRAADALEETFRNSDVIARLGGDEFAVLALEASCEDRNAILRRLDKTLKGSNSGDSRYRLSLSVGMARFDPKRPVSLGKLIATADAAMYEEKKNHPKLSLL